MINDRLRFLLMACLAGMGLRAAASPARAEAPRPPDRSATRPNVIMIFTDDQGYADLGIQGRVNDIRTPSIDRLAREGVRMTAGYVTAPQCVPSRAGLLTGRYQQRFGVDHNGKGPLPLGEATIARRLQGAGYTTGMVGKWHLDPNRSCTDWIRKHLPQVAAKPPRRRVIPGEAALRYFPENRGFTEYFCGSMHRYRANYDRKGRDLAAGERWIHEPGFRIDVQSDAAIAFIERNHDKPFFLYVAYFAPHVPLEATPKYLSAFPGPMPERRRYCLAMVAAVDAGVGRILQSLRKHRLDEKTLVVFISDNGAPLKIDKKDLPISFRGGAWDGSLNDPWVGEKGMLTEGGIRVPFLMRWKGTLPAGLVYRRPVISLDVGATVAALAGLPEDPDLDGTNLVPYLTGAAKGDPHKYLFWRFWSQAAVRSGKWKYLQVGAPPQRREFLFDVEGDSHETRNLIAAHPDIAAGLARQLEAWSRGLKEPGLRGQDANPQEAAWYAHYFERVKNRNHGEGRGGD